jgi:hypothetical protein
MTSSGKPRGRPRSSPKASKQSLAKQGGLQIVINTRSKQARVEDEPESPNVDKKKRQRNEFLKNLEKKAAAKKRTVVSDDDEDEDEFADLRLSMRRQSLQDESAKLIELFNAVGISASNFIASMDKFLSNGHVSGVEDWLDTCGLDINDDRVNSVENLCNTIARILRGRRTPKVTKQQKQSPGDISIAPSDQFFAYRENSMSLSILVPVELFTSSSSLKNKTCKFTWTFKLRTNYAYGFPSWFRTFEGR